MDEIDEIDKKREEDEDEDELLRLPFWNVNLKMNTLTPLQWIDYVEKVKKLSQWNDETTMSNVEKLIGKEALIRFFAKVKKVLTH